MATESETCAVQAGGQLSQTKAISRDTDLTGWKPEGSRLTVLRQTDRDAHGKQRLVCRCDCGNECVTRRTDLLSGMSRSCGCLRRESGARNARRLRSAERSADRRRVGTKATTEQLKQASTRAAVRALIEVSAALIGPDTLAAMADRPVVRGDCADGPRPCPWVSCRHHLYLDVTPSGGLKLNFPGLEPEDLERSCSLDEADREGVTYDAVGQRMNITRERVRQIEQIALRKLKRIGR